MSEPLPFPLERVSWAAALTEEHRLQMRDDLEAAAEDEAARAGALDHWREIALRDAARSRLVSLRRAG
ncbi:MAG: hypothetical protein R3C39_03105 [Dehalococcoidia bacterium]